MLQLKRAPITTNIPYRGVRVIVSSAGSYVAQQYSALAGFMSGYHSLQIPPVTPYPLRYLLMYLPI